MKAIIIICIILTSAIIGHTQNLILNTSFESNGIFECQDWFDGCDEEITYICDSIIPLPYCGAYYIDDTPTGGGSWGIYLSSSMLPPQGEVRTYITGLSNTYVYELKAWMKTNDQSSGTIALGMLSQGQFTESMKVTDQSISWTQYTITDTLTTSVSDTIAIQLLAGYGTTDIGQAYFDLIELTITDTLVSREDLEHPKDDVIHIYPNPAYDNLTIEISDRVNENLQLTIYSSTGRLVRFVEIRNRTFTIHEMNFVSGLYFYEIQRSVDKTLIGRGRFMKQ